MSSKNDINRIKDNIINRLPVILSFDLFLYKRYIKPNNKNIDINNFILSNNFICTTYYKNKSKN